MCVTCFLPPGTIYTGTSPRTGVHGLLTYCKSRAGQAWFIVTPPPDLLSAHNLTMMIMPACMILAYRDVCAKALVMAQDSSCVLRLSAL